MLQKERVVLAELKIHGNRARSLTLLLDQLILRLRRIHKLSKNLIVNTLHLLLSHLILTLRTELELLKFREDVDLLIQTLLSLNFTRNGHIEHVHVHLALLVGREHAIVSGCV